jgi:hypothetical protein
MVFKALPMSSDLSCSDLVEDLCKLDFVVTIVIVQMCLVFKKGLSRSLDLD